MNRLHPGLLSLPRELRCRGTLSSLTAVRGRAGLGVEVTGGCFETGTVLRLHGRWRPHGPWLAMTAQLFDARPGATTDIEFRLHPTGWVATVVGKGFRLELDPVHATVEAADTPPAG